MKLLIGQNFSDKLHFIKIANEECISNLGKRIYIALNEQCYDKRYDLVSQQNHYNLDGSIEPICSVGLSRQLLTNIGEYAKTRHFLPFIEYMFNTIDMHNELNVYCPRELSTINNWIFKEIQERPMNRFHPIKNFQQQRRFRGK